MRFVFLFCLSFFVIASSVQAKTLPYFEGVPLLDGFEVSDGDVLIFDKPEGRIVEIMVWCEDTCPSPEKISRYYKEALLPLGWISSKNNHFVKERSKLSFSVQKEMNTDQTIIVFRGIN